MPLKDNVKARKTAEELMDLGITLGKEQGLSAEYVRVYWQHVVRMANQLIGENGEQSTSSPNRKSKSVARGTIRLTDDDPMPVGKKFKGVRLGDVPDWYLNWLGEQDWIDSYPDLVEYINVVEEET